MLSRASWLHLRFPFSYFLLPVFLFSVALSPNLDGSKLFWIFFILHFLLYPASNGYNSYFDKDEESIGALKNPPPVTKGLYYLSLLLDTLALVLGLVYVNLTFVVMLLVYGAASKAYSHPAIRLKKYAVMGWLVAGFFQGFFTLLMCYAGINNFTLDIVWEPRVLYAGLLASLMLLGSYPMTQVYQHAEDARRGDYTFSRLLGIRGTFGFVAGVFAFVFAGFFWYFKTYFSAAYGLAFGVALAPVVIFFSAWGFRVMKEETAANYSGTMWLNFISATCLNAFFLYLFLHYSHVLEAVLP